MRICLKLRVTSGTVPVHYNYLVQSFLYRRFPPKSGRLIHDRGVEEGPRRFKLFTFSRLYGDFARVGDQLKFKDFAYLCVSSIFRVEMKYLARSLLQDSEVRIGRATFAVDSLKVVEFPEESREFYTLSPIVVTKRTDRTKYLMPHHEEFGMLLELNLKRKVRAVKGRQLRSPILVRFVKWRRVLTVYKGNPVVGVMGKFSVDGPKTALEVGYYAGLGVKNSQGFGMFEAEGRGLRDLMG